MATEQPDFGVDIDCASDIGATLSVASGYRNLGNALARRYMTPRGDLFYDQDYGLDLREWINEGLTDSGISELVDLIEAEARKDDRVLDLSADVTFDRSTSKLTVAMDIETAEGPYRMILGVDEVTVQLLNEGLEPFDISPTPAVLLPEPVRILLPGIQGPAGAAGPAGPEGASSGGDWSAWKVLGGSGSTGHGQDRLYIAGANEMADRIPIMSSTTPTGGFLYAMPQVFDQACRLLDVMTYTTSLKSWVYGVYANLGGGLLYPGALLAQSSQFAAPAGGQQFRTWNLSTPINITPKTLLWFVFHCNTTSDPSGLIGTLDNAARVSILGFDPDDFPVNSPNSRMGSMWIKAQTYSATLPSTFPTGGTAPTIPNTGSGDAYPAMFYRLGTP